VEQIDTPDPRTVRVHLADSFTPFVHRLAEPWSAILPPEVEDRLGDLKAAESLIGCGPFVLDRYEAGVKAVFSRNPTYHARGLPYLDKVEWLFIKDRSTQLALFRAGQVDVPYHDARIPRSDVGAFKKTNPGYPVVFWDWLAVRSLAMRTDRAPFNDVRVRRALSLAVDRKKWVAEHLDGEGTEDQGPVPSSMRPWKLAARQLGEGARYLEYDPGLARKLLAEAGYPAGLKIKCTNWPGYGPEYVDDLERLAGHLRRVGVELQILNEEYGQYIRGSLLGRFDEASWGPSAIFTEVDGYLYSFFRSGQAGNRSHVADTQLDVMLEAQRRFTSTSSRKKIIDDIQRRAAAQVYYVYTPYPRNVSSWAPRVQNYGPKNSFDRGAQLEVVWLDQG
jgi:ABC-type transport system substrate-binding protein